MDEFAINTSSTFSFGSAPGSSLNVYSPYRPTGTSSTSGGSSGGTGASVSANLAALGFGTDTGGSIRVPSSYNQLVGLRPTVGLTSRSGIVPLALSQDIGGPLARTVSDVAIALDAVVGTDPDDPATATSSSHVPPTYTAFLNKNGLQGKRIGYDPSMVGTNATVVRDFNQLKADLEAQGATVVPITIPSLSTILGEASGSTNEFNHDLNNYIAAHLNPAVPYRSLTRSPTPAASSSPAAARRAAPTRTAVRSPRRPTRPGSRRTVRTSRTSAPPSPAHGLELARRGDVPDRLAVRQRRQQPAAQPEHGPAGAHGADGHRHRHASSSPASAARTSSSSDGRTPSRR